MHLRGRANSDAIAASSQTDETQPARPGIPMAIGAGKTSSMTVSPLNVTSKDIFHAKPQRSEILKREPNLYGSRTFRPNRFNPWATHVTLRIQHDGAGEGSHIRGVAIKSDFCLKISGYPRGVFVLMVRKLVVLSNNLPRAVPQEGINDQLTV
jgi:hypothetical protein